MRLRTMSVCAIASSQRPRANNAWLALFRFIAPRRRSSPESSFSAIAASDSSRHSSLRPAHSSSVPEVHRGAANVLVRAVRTGQIQRFPKVSLTVFNPAN